MTLTEKNLYRKPQVVLREESDEWSLLFDPDSGKILAVNPIGTCIWKKIDGSLTVDDIFYDIQKTYQNVPETALGEISQFIERLIDQGMIGYYLRD
jgi:SynChlorMet cassette protein ScmD